MRFVLGVVAAVGLLGCGGSDVEGVDALESLGQEIVGGREVRPGSYPWIVSLQQGGSHFCGGTLIRTGSAQQSDIVLTAAHCVYDGTSGLTVSAGAHDLKRPGPGVQTVSAGVTRYHPQYNPDTTMNDIAVIKLAAPIKFTATVQPLALPASGERPAVGALATVAGWGLTREGGYDTSPILMHVSVPIVGDAYLAAAYRPYDVSIDANAMLGAGYPEGGKDACQADSGGPLFVRGADDKPVLQGIVSFGVGCARPGLPGVYTRVSSYLSWIDASIIALSQTRM
jgi:secreted trypsin-like serine protease